MGLHLFPEYLPSSIAVCHYVQKKPYAFHKAVSKDTTQIDVPFVPPCPPFLPPYFFPFLPPSLSSSLPPLVFSRIHINIYNIYGPHMHIYIYMYLIKVT